MTDATIRTVSATHEPSPIVEQQRSWLAFGLILLGVGAAAVSILGPLVSGVIEYHASDTAVNQIVGGDLAGLVLVAPLSIAAAILVWRRHEAGAVLALGPSAYALYMYSQLALGGDFIRYEGNSERFFPLFLGLFILAAAILVSAWRAIDVDSLPRAKRWADRSVGIFFLVVAFFLAVGLHLPGLVDAWADQPTSTEYLADPVVFWLVKFMDLAIVVPILLITGIGLLRDSPWVRKAKYAVVGWAALLGSSVAGMAITMQATGDPAATTVNTIAFSTFAAVAIWFAFIAYKPLFGTSRADQKAAREPGVST